MSYLDFELKIDDLGGGRYRSTVIDSPMGKEQAGVFADFSLPFADDAIQRMLAVLGGQANVSATERSRMARTFGEVLFRAAFSGSVLVTYRTSQDRARALDGLRIKLSLEGAGALSTWPWEFLRDPAVDYLALSRATPVIRHPHPLVTRSRPALTLPLRVLVMVSSPADMEPVDMQTEWNNLQAATAGLRSRGMLELTLLEDASLRTLQQVLRIGEYHVFHYIGHSMFDAATGQGMLALEDPLGENNAYPVRGELLARELGEENTIRLVVLNSCQSAAASEIDPMAGIANSIVARGIPAVVAMQYAIADRAARAFSEELYRSVAEGLPVDAAVSEARRAISNTVDGIEWATPVLFMHAPDGTLFDVRRPRRSVWLGGAAAAALLVLIAILAFWGLRGRGHSSSAVDLVINRIEVIPARPDPGERVAVIVHIQNNSKKTIGPFSYDFREDVLDATPSFTGRIDSLSPGGTETIFVPHRFSWWGPFVPEVRLDVDNGINETDEFNNIGRTSVVTNDGPFVFTFEELPDGDEIDDSVALSDASFEAWGVRFEAVPKDAAACGAAVPWIIVRDDAARYLGTGLPDDPAACTDGSIAVAVDRSAVGGVVASVRTTTPAVFGLTVFNGQNTALDQTALSLPAGRGVLEIASSFMNRLSIARAVVAGGDGLPLQIESLSLSGPVAR